MLQFLSKPFRQWLYALHDEMRLVREETIGLRADVAAMRADMREVSELLRTLLEEVKRLREHTQPDVEDDTPKWEM